MIALCPVCHGRAEGGAWTKEQLREFKRSPKSPQVIRETFGFPEPGRGIVYRLGGNYAFSSPIILAIAGIPLLWEEVSPSGVHSFSLNVMDHRNRTSLLVLGNSVSIDTLLTWDCFFNTHGNHLIIRRKKGSIALELKVRRLTMDELKNRYQADSAASKGSIPDPRLPLLSAAGNQRNPYEAGLESVWQNVEDGCLDSDGKICLIDVVRANLYANGRWLAIRNGMEAGASLAACISGSNAGGAFSLSGKPVLYKHFETMFETFSPQDALIVHREELELEVGRAASQRTREIYDRAVERFPAMMAIGAGLHAFRIGQRNPNFLL